MTDESRAGRPRDDEGAAGVPDAALLAERAGEYLAVWESAAARLVNAEYHSEDLIDDWFTCWGKWVRDSTALATIGWKAWSGVGSPTFGIVRAERVGAEEAPHHGTDGAKDA